MLLRYFILSSLDRSTGQSFKTIPTQAEWAHFQEYARRIRTLNVNPSQDPLPPDVLLTLQHRTLNTPLLPGLEAFVCREATAEFTPFIPLFLSPRTAIIDIVFVRTTPETPALMVASMITTFPALCPNLVEIALHRLPTDRAVFSAVSDVLLACNRNTLQRFEVDSPLTSAAREVLCQSSNLRKLRSIVLGDVFQPPFVLPNLVKMEIVYTHGHEWLRNVDGTMLNKLTSVSFYPLSPQVGNLLEAFEAFAVATSISTKLSTFKIYSKHPWDPNYSSLLGFKQLTELLVLIACRDSCSSTVNDDIITGLARAMPKLKILQLGQGPCETPTGVTAKGLVELACHCNDLSILRVHIRVDSLVQAAIGDATTSPSNAEPTVSRAECALTTLEVGNMTIPVGSALTVALALLHIFPRISNIKYMNSRWEDVQNTIKLSNQLFNRIGALARSSSEVHPQHPETTC